MLDTTRTTNILLIILVAAVLITGFLTWRVENRLCGSSRNCIVNVD